MFKQILKELNDLNKTVCEFDYEVERNYYNERYVSGYRDEFIEIKGQILGIIAYIESVEYMENNEDFYTALTDIFNKKMKQYENKYARMECKTIKDSLKYLLNYERNKGGNGNE